MGRMPLWNRHPGGGILIVCTAAIIALSSICPVLAGEPLRLAILSSEEVQNSGISDLLTVQMQELPNVELVERDLLHKVTDELILSMMLGAEHTENRRKAGALLKADMLAILSAETADGREPTLRITIGDCSNGARLRVGWVPFEKKSLDANCRQLKEIIQQTLDHFETGVKQIIGVSHFISRDLVHDYDHLQTGYARLLQSALSSLPGVAVIEVEEARSIARENELAGDGKIDRVVPLFVDGEFRTRKGGSQEQVTVHLKIRISDNAATAKEIERQDLPLNQVAAFLTNDVAREILVLSKSSDVKLLDTGKQLQALTRNADEFARVGDRRHSTELREAAVLLKPDCVEQRVRLIEEYHLARLNGAAWRYNFGPSKYETWRTSFEHLEYMILNRMINITESLELSRKTFYGLSLAAKQYKKEFLLKIFPEILHLQPADPATEKDERDKWYGLLIAQIVDDRFNFGGVHEKGDLDFYLDIHRVVPDEIGPSSTFIRLFLQKHAIPNWRRQQPLGRLWHYPPEYFTEQDFLDFANAMSRSGKPLSSFYGRYALLLCEYNRRRRYGKEVDDLYGKAILLDDDVTNVYGTENHLWREIANIRDQIEKARQERLHQKQPGAEAEEPGKQS